jgi:Right handed beta helix region
MVRTRFIAMLTIGVCLSAYAFAAGKYAVGTCLPKMAFYATISDAVSSVPPGSIIEVCPGNYPEQVLITQPLTLEGITAGGSEAVVAVPSGGLTQNQQDSFSDLYYQILVETTGPVNITNLAVDGTGAYPSSGSIAGIFYQDSSGTVSHVSVRNQAYDGQGYPLVATTYAGAAAQTVVVQNSVFRSFDGAGIRTGSSDGTMTVNLTANTIDGGALNGVDIFFSASTGTIQSNTISNGLAGLTLDSSNVTVSGNTFSQRTGSILPVVDSQGTTGVIKGNKIDAGGGIGLALYYLTTSLVVQGNSITNSSTAVAGCVPPVASGYTVTGNTITDAAIGVQMPAGNTSAPNNFYATASAVAACP